MIDNSIPQEVLERIVKVLNLAENAGTEGEAAAAAAAAARMLEKYNLNMADVRDTEIRKQHLGDIVKIESNHLDHDSARKSEWVHRLLHEIAKSHYCYPLVTKRTVLFVGRDLNAKAAIQVFNYLYTVLCSICETEKEAFVRKFTAYHGISPWKTGYHNSAIWRKSWLSGATTAVCQTMRQQREGSANATTAIVAVSSAEIKSFLDQDGRHGNAKARRQGVYGDVRNEGYNRGLDIAVNALKGAQQQHDLLGR